MKTGNQIFKYYTYSIIWANKIIAEVKGYSIDKAYAISPLFGSMVEKQLDNYQRQLDRLRYTASVFGVFDECKSMFDKFYEVTRKDIDYLLNNPKDMLSLVQYDFYFSGCDSDELDSAMRQAFAFNKMWDRKMAYVMEQIGNISLEKTKWLPAQYANIFKEQHQIINDLVSNIGVYNKLLYDYHWDKLTNEDLARHTSEIGEYEASNYYGSEVENVKNWFKEQDEQYVEVQLQNITTYKANMVRLEQIREDLLND